MFEFFQPGTFVLLGEDDIEADRVDLVEIEQVTDDSDLEEVYNTERHLLYVACSRAREHLLITGVEPSSRFLDALKE